jgi:hypothetical protein
VLALIGQRAAVEKTIRRFSLFCQFISLRTAAALPPK